MTLRRLGRLTVLSLAIATIAVAGAALAVGVVIPRLGGGVPYTVLSGSMSPTLERGSLVIVRPTDDIGIGDIVTYQLNSGQRETVTHRVVGFHYSPSTGEQRLVTRGDANHVDDEKMVRPVQVRGAYWYSVPHLGRVSVMATPDERQIGIYVLVGALLTYAAWQIVSSTRSRRTPQVHAPNDSPLQEGDSR